MQPPRRTRASFAGRGPASTTSSPRSLSPGRGPGGARRAHRRHADGRRVLRELPDRPRVRLPCRGPHRAVPDRGAMREKPGVAPLREFLVANEERNGLIASIARERLELGESVLVLVDRKEHGGGSGISSATRPSSPTAISREASSRRWWIASPRARPAAPRHDRLFTRSLDPRDPRSSGGRAQSRAKVIQSIGRGMRPCTRQAPVPVRRFLRRRRGARAPRAQRAANADASGGGVRRATHARESAPAPDPRPMRPRGRTCRRAGSSC